MSFRPPKVPKAEKFAQKFEKDKPKVKNSKNNFEMIKPKVGSNCKKNDIFEIPEKKDADKPEKLDTETEEDFLLLEKSICSSDERLCVSCKCIVPSVRYEDHFSECLLQFSFKKRESSRVKSSLRSSKSTEDKTETISNKNEEIHIDTSNEILPCPTCLKVILLVLFFIFIL